MIHKNLINFTSETRINPINAKVLIPKKTGIYFWFDKKLDEIVYIGVGAGSRGLYNRIVRQHLNLNYIEYRPKRHAKKDFFQLKFPVKGTVKGEIQFGIDKSSFRKNIGRKLNLKPGEETLNYILDNLYIKYKEINNIKKLRKVEKQLIAKYKPMFNEKI